MFIFFYYLYSFLFLTSLIFSILLLSNARHYLLFEA